MPDITEVYAFLFCPFIEQNLFGRYQNIFTPTKKGCNLAKGCAVAVFMCKITQKWKLQSVFCFSLTQCTNKPQEQQCGYYN